MYSIMKTHEIKRLSEILNPMLGSKKLLNYSTKPLTVAGENYGSLMLSVDPILESDSKQEILKLVAKLVPRNEWSKKMFNVQVTFKKEIYFYCKILPALQEFQREHGVEAIIDFFPKCYGSRISLNPNSDEVDEDALLLLENLQVSDYSIADRMVGFDLEQTELILRNLAAFHAVPVALKLEKADEFNSKIRLHLDHPIIFDLEDQVINVINANILKAIKLNENCEPYVASVEELMQNVSKLMKNPYPSREPFATICHSDYWVNNIMLKFVDGKPVKNAMIDFQLYEYGSPANDLIFFLHSSVETRVLDANYDHFLRIYYSAFVQTLKDLKCSVTRFSYDAFLEELEIARKTQFLRLLWLYRFIFLSSQEAVDVSEHSMDKILFSTDGLSEIYYTRLWHLVAEFGSKKWI